MVASASKGSWPVDHATGPEVIRSPTKSVDGQRPVVRVHVHAVAAESLGDPLSRPGVVARQRQLAGVEQVHLLGPRRARLSATLTPLGPPPTIASVDAEEIC